MSQKVSATEAARRFSAAPRVATMTLRRLVERLQSTERPDDRFADDLEAIQAAQPRAIC